MNLTDFQIAFFMIGIVATVLGNLLVLAAVFYDSRLRTVTNYFVACLAVSDILVACLSGTIRLLTYFEIRRNDLEGIGILNIHVCRFWNWIDIFCEAASIYTLTIISIDRYFKISRPFVYRERMTKTVAITTIVAIWALAALLASLGLVPFGDAKGITLSDGSNCVNLNKMFYTMAAVVAFFLPLLVLIVMYTLIFRIALYHFKKENAAVTMLDPVSGKQLHYSAYKDLKATRTLFIVVSTFVICWGPFFVLFQIDQHQPHILKELEENSAMVVKLVFYYLLPFANSFFNPIIYACFDKTYRRSFRKILLKIIGRSEYLGSSKDDSNQHKNRTSVFELTTTQPRHSLISLASGDQARSPDEERCFYYSD